MARYLRKLAVGRRYGIDPRNIERKVWNGILPNPEYPIGRIPLWDEDELDRHDRAVVTTTRKPATLDDITRLITKISAAPTHRERLSVFCSFRITHSLEHSDVNKIVDILRELKTGAEATP